MENKVAESKKKGISGSTLKLIALVTMLIDHIGAAVVWRVVLLWSDGMVQSSQVSIEAFKGLVMFNQILRYIGRISFPIYCFLLVEGFQKTHNKWKYAMRMGMFALISEIPFDLAFSSKVLEFSNQNVFFTLFLGLIAMILVEEIEQKNWFKTSLRWNGIAQQLLSLLAVGAIAGLAWFMRTDYDAIGVVCIMLLYLFRKNKVSQIMAGVMAFMWEVTAPLAFIPIAFYNGERGLNLKYLFYLFYPLHLLILYLICVAMGIGGIPAI